MRKNRFRDGLSPAQRRKLRREFWRNPPLEKPRHRWTEKLCRECGRWIKWEAKCEHLRQPPSAAPEARVFKPYFHPNAGEGGVWLESRAAERECFRVNKIRRAY